jgi:Outer membrane lipoprotein-sorting protein
MKPIALVFFALSLLPALAAEYPPASAVLQSIRRAQANQKMELKGSLETQPADAMKRPTEASFRMIADGSNLRYVFSDPEPVTLHIKMGETDSELMQTGGTDAGKFTPANFSKKILGTDLSYEDLALKFIYWSRGAVEGEDHMKTMDAWRIRLQAPPGGRSAYKEVVLWVGKSNGALVRADGFDAAGKLTKRFEVVSAQVVRGLWVLQRLRIETYDPATGKLISRTRMTIDAPPES